jgi:oxygen-independent coproporphyrinogen-3 oxidase
MQKDFVRKHGGPAPRYTSYPTAPHFHAGIDGETYARWLRGLEPGQTLSLYIHIPWCDRLCWFCGCNTKQTLRYDPLKTYLSALENEMETISGLVDPKCRVTALHLGGGSPTMLRPEDMVALNQMLRSRFSFDADAEISVEMDPNDLTAEKYDALAEIGMTRASIGCRISMTRSRRRSTASRPSSSPGMSSNRYAHAASGPSTAMCFTACRIKPANPSIKP